MTKPIIDRYQRWLYHYRNPDGKPLTFHSQYTHLSPIKSWFKWLARENYILFNPASELDMPRLNRSLPKHILTASEVDQIINGADANTALGVRDRAILETFYSTGLRRLEVVHLKLYDVDLERATVMVRDGKWHKDRFVPVGERTVLWLNKYLADVRPLLAPPREDTLFLTNAGEPFTPDSMTQLARDYVEKAKLPGGKRGACHVFRHTMATLMLEGGADIRYIQAMLGHADLSTTQIYTHVGIRNLQQVHAATHPSGMLKRPGSPPPKAPPTDATSAPIRRQTCAPSTTSWVIKMTAATMDEPAHWKPSGSTGCVNFRLWRDLRIPPLPRKVQTPCVPRSQVAPGHGETVTYKKRTFGSFYLALLHYYSF